MIDENESATGEFKHIGDAVQIAVAKFALEMANGDWEKLLGDPPARGSVYYSPSRKQIASQHFRSNTVAVAQLDDQFHIIELTVTYAKKDREPEDGYPRKWHGGVASAYADMVANRPKK